VSALEALASVGLPDLCQTLLYADLREHHVDTAAIIFREDASQSEVHLQGADVEVSIRWSRNGRTSADVLPLRAVWALVDEEISIDSIGAPPESTMPAIFTALSRASDQLGELLVLDRVGSVGGLLSPSSAGEVRRTILRYARTQERARLQKAQRRLGKFTTTQIFDTGAACHLLEAPERRGTMGNPLRAWRTLVVIDGDFAAVSDNFGQVEFGGRTATAGIAAAAVEAWGTTKPGALSSNVWLQSIEALDTERGSFPSPSFERPRRAPEPHELKPRPSDQREWSDDTGEIATALADGTLSIPRAMAEVWPSTGASELIGRWVAAGLDERSVKVMFLHELGFSNREVGDFVGRHHGTVARILRAAQKILEK